MYGVFTSCWNGSYAVPSCARCRTSRNSDGWIVCIPADRPTFAGPNPWEWSCKFKKCVSFRKVVICQWPHGHSAPTITFWVRSKQKYSFRRLGTRAGRKFEKITDVAIRPRSNGDFVLFIECKFCDFVSYLCWQSISMIVVVKQGPRLLLVVLSLAVIGYSSAQNVLGVDFGSEFIKLAVVQRSAGVQVLTQPSHRFKYLWSILSAKFCCCSDCLCFPECIWESRLVWRSNLFKFPGRSVTVMKIYSRNNIVSSP